VVVGLADPLQERQRGGRLLLVDLRQREPDVDQHPVARPDLLPLEQADVDRPPHPADVDLGQVRPVGIELDDLAGNPEAHQATRRRRFTALLTSPVTMPLPVWKACLRRPTAISFPDSTAEANSSERWISDQDWMSFDIPSLPCCTPTTYPTANPTNAIMAVPPSLVWLSCLFLGHHLDAHPHVGVDPEHQDVGRLDAEVADVEDLLSLDDERMLVGSGDRHL